VLFVLQRYQSPSLAGLTVLLSILPGLALSPVAGALLDRQGVFADDPRLRGDGGPMATIVVCRLGTGCRRRSSC